jgi:tetratricopeptide (TPR) repeat protein
MPRTLTVLTVLASLAGTTVVALAHPKSIRLTQEQIDAAEEAVHQAQPHNDTPHVRECEKQEKDDATGAELLALADCYQSALAPGGAIQVWERVVAEMPKSPEAKTALRALGPAYEAWGEYDKAAADYDAYARAYHGEADARDAEVRAVCTWEQLGTDDAAARGLTYLGTWRKIRFDADHLCDAVRPIQPPAP